MKASDMQNRQPLTYNLAAEKIIHARGVGYESVDFFGGEPTCFPFLKRAIRLANKLDMTVILATNAVKFSSRSYTDNFFAGINIRGIRTSLHSYRPEVHDAITGKRGNFHKTVKGARNILLYNKKLFVNVVINAMNYKDIIAMPDYIHGLGACGIKFSGLMLCGRALTNKWLFIDPSVYLHDLLRALRRAKRLGFHYIEVEKFPSSIFDSKRMGFVKFLDRR